MLLIELKARVSAVCQKRVANDFACWLRAGYRRANGKRVDAALSYHEGSDPEAECLSNTDAPIITGIGCTGSRMLDGSRQGTAWELAVGDHC